MIFTNYTSKEVLGSCEWILDRSWSTNWSSPDFPSRRTKLLWVNGPAGFGKSILCAKILEHLSAMDMPIAHFFFSSSFESRGNPFIAIRSWLSQLISHSGVFESIRDVWETTRGERTTRGEVVNLLQEVVSTNPGCTLILDGLDECDCISEAHSVVNTSDSTARFLETLRQATTGTSTRILIVSRDEPQIRHFLSNDRAHDPIQEYRITPEDNENDILSYSRSIVSERLPKKTAATREETTQRLADRCNGQFLWIKLQQNTLRSGKSQKRLEEAIDATPAGLETLYERNWTKISQLPEEDRSRAFSLLRWAAFSLRPLTVIETSAAVLDQDDCDELLLDDLPDSIDEDYTDTEILEICGSLLKIRGPEGDHDAGLRTVNLAHFSVKEYLLRNIPTQINTLFTISTEDAESTRLAKKCLRFVNCQKIWHGTSDAEKDQVLSSFQDYAADSWHHHATVGGMNDPDLLDLINRLFDVDNPSWFQWKRWFESKKMDSESLDTTSRIETTGPLFYAVWLGLENLVKLLLNQAKLNYINDKSYEGQSSLCSLRKARLGNR